LTKSSINTKLAQYSAFKAEVWKNCRGKLTKKRKTKNMKLIKLASMTIMATLALGIYSAKATSIVGTTTNYSTLKVALTVKQQAADTTNGDNIIYKITTTKLTNKELLSFLGTAFSRTWPAGAQLEYDWTFNQAIVADTTGTNVLFYCGNGVTTNGVTDTNVIASLTLYWDYSMSGGVYSGKDDEATRGSTSFDEYTLAYFVLFYDVLSDDTAYTDLYGYGQDASKYTEKWTSAATHKWTDTESINLAGTGYWSDEPAVFTGTISAKGKGNGTLLGP
jgi:hypothetical protein